MQYVYKVIAFIVDNWKKPIKAMIATYMVIAGVMYLLGVSALPIMNLTLPSVGV